MQTPLALVNARVWAGPEAGLAGDAIAFDQGRVVAVGRRENVLKAVASRPEVFDCQGRWVVPGFIDAHVHLKAAASVQAAIDLSAVRSSAELLGTIRAKAASAPPGWLSFAGLQLDDPPSQAELDAAAPEHLIRVRHRSLHAWLLNGRALLAAGLSPSPVTWWQDHGGELGRRLGRVTDAAAFEQALASWSRVRLAEGVTTVVDATATNGPEQLAILKSWHEVGILLQRPAALLASPVATLAGNVVPIAGVKVLVPPGNDQRRELDWRIRDAWSHGHQAAVHCTDLETMGALIDVLDGAGSGRGRVRLEHASICPPDWLGLVARLNASVVTHPAFIYSHGDRYLEDASLAPHEWLYRLASWRRSGVGIAIGSDAPAGPADPLAALRAAISRRTKSGRSLGPDERLSPVEALAATTAWAADVSNLHDVGRLNPGMRAAAIVLEGRPLSHKLAIDTQVTTVVNGSVLQHK